MSSAATSLLPPAAVAQLDTSGSVTLVGHSLGAMVALAYLARRSRARPADPDSLVLVATAAGRLPEHGLGHLLATPGIGGLCRLVEHAPAHALRAQAAPACAELGRWSGCGQTQRATLVALASAALATTPASTAVGFLPVLRQFDVNPLLGSIRASTVVVSGGADLLTPPVHGRDIAEHIPGAVHLCVPGAGQMPQQAPRRCRRHRPSDRPGRPTHSVTSVSLRSIRSGGGTLHPQHQHQEAHRNRMFSGANPGLKYPILQPNSPT
jgi:pimeloyl-ACP methyl ester carboxylesterase